MKDNRQNEKFTYTYSVPTVSERREIEDIRRQYSAPQEPQSALARLKELDARVKRTPAVFAMIMGVCGLLVFGLGFTMVLEWAMFAGGIAVAAVGALMMAAAYPIFKTVLKRLKKKYAPEILKLSDELLNEGKE